MMAIALGLHVLASVLWVGGMIVMLSVVRPVAIKLLEPPLRIVFLQKTMGRFFVKVWGSIVIILVTAGWMINHLGGMANVGWWVHAMSGLGVLMVLLFIYIYVIYRRLVKAVKGEQWQEGAAHLGLLRKIVLVNLILGLLVVIIASGGRYF